MKTKRCLLRNDEGMELKSCEGSVEGQEWVGLG